LPPSSPPPQPPPPPLCFPPVSADYATYGGGSGGTNRPFAPTPLPYTHTTGSASAMSWAYVEASSQGGWTSYPSGWSVSRVKVCVSLYHSDGLSGVLTLQLTYVNGGDHRVSPLMRNQGGLATNLTHTCFDDSASEELPAVDSGAPFSATWKPPGTSLQTLVDAGLGRVAGQLRLGVWVVSDYAWASSSPVGYLTEFSVEVCFTPPPVAPPPPLPPPVPPSPPAPPATICLDSCLNWADVTDAETGASMLISYEGYRYQYGDGTGNGPGPPITGSAGTCSAAGFCWSMGPWSRAPHRASSSYYNAANDGWCDDGVAPVPGGAAYDDATRRTQGFYGDGRNYYAFKLSHSPISVGFHTPSSGSAPNGAPNSRMSLSSDSSGYVHLPNACEYGHDCTDCGARPASGKTWRRLSESHNEVEWVHYRANGYMTPRGSYYDRDLIREMAIGKRTGLFVNFSLPLAHMYAIEAYDEETHSIPDLTLERQVQVLLRLGLDHTTARGIVYEHMVRIEET